MDKKLMFAVLTAFLLLGCTRPNANEECKEIYTKKVAFIFVGDMNTYLGNDATLDMYNPYTERPQFSNGWAVCENMGAFNAPKECEFKYMGDPCRYGSKPNENINYLYCGFVVNKFMAQTDSSGKISDSYHRYYSVKLEIDKPKNSGSGLYNVTNVYCTHMGDYREAS